MANPRRPGANAGPTTGAEIPPFEPVDPDAFRQKLLLNEASLASFTATPSELAPYGRSTLAWAINMPTSVIPGVHVEAHMWAPDFDQVIEPTGNVIVFPYVDTTYSIYLKTQLAVRELGKLELGVNLGTCTSVDYPPSVFEAIVIAEGKKPFPAGGQVFLRGDGPSLETGYNSFVVSVPLEISVDNWFNPEVDITLGFSVSSENGTIKAKYGYSSTNVSFGIKSAILSAGCTPFIAKALEKQAAGFLDQFIGPVIAERVEEKLVAEMQRLLHLKNTEPPLPIVPYRFYDLLLNDDGLSYRFCPQRPLRPGEGTGNPDDTGGLDPG